MSGIGHLGLGLAAKKTMPKMPLVVLLLAPMLLDILWVVFTFAGIDSNVWSHGLFMSVVWSLITAVLAGVITHSIREGLTLRLLVFSHWVVDYVTHPMSCIFPNLMSA